tara:strand:- start:237014 stop:237991 length:978 start_codon:yes stop_codon:yes gene_type:complete
MSANNHTNSIEAISHVTEHEAGQRIDNYLINKLKPLPKSRIYKMVRKGEVRINSKRITISYRLGSGDKLRLPPFIEKLVLEQRSHKASEPELPLNVKNNIIGNILYEDDGMIILNKPSGLAVHGGSGISFGLIESCRKIWPDAPFLELVHRLDRDTSGCIMIAKSRKRLLQLHELLKTNQITKRYYALVSGKWQGGRQVCAPLKKQTTKSGERMVKVHTEGNDSKTLFTIEQTFQNHTLLKVQPITGRTHQIRVHAAFMGHPIIGDSKYGHKGNNQEAKALDFNRLFLHACELYIPLENTIHIKCPLPKECQTYLNQLENLKESS